MQEDSSAGLQSGSGSMQTTQLPTRADGVIHPIEESATDEGADLLDIIGAASIQ